MEICLGGMGDREVRFAMEEAGTICSRFLKKPDAPPVLLHDFNDRKYEENPAPY